MIRDSFRVREIDPDVIVMITVIVAMLVGLAAVWIGALI
jgi:preprotein translocase subunit Sec61beta